MTKDTLHPAVREHIRNEWDPVDYAAVDIPALIVDQGDVSSNAAKYGAKWQFNPCAPKPLNLDAAVGANGKMSSFVNRPGMQGGDIEFLGFTAKSLRTSGAAVRFLALPKSVTLNLELANHPVVSTLLFGRGLVGAPWPASFYEPGTGNILFQCSNLEAVAAAVECVGIGRRFIGEAAQATIEARRAKFLTSRINPFFVVPDPTSDEQGEFTLGAGSTLDLQCTLPSVGDFLAVGLRDDSSRFDGGVEVAGTPKYSLTIKDGVDGYNLMGSGDQGDAIPISIDLIASMSLASVDPRLPAPSFDGSQGGIFTHLFARSSKILLHLVNDDTVDIKVRLAFPGVILRYKPAPNRNTNTSEAVRREILDRSQPTYIGNIVQGGRS